MATAIEQRAQQAPRAEGFHRLTGVQILATGSYAPDEIVTNGDLAELGYDANWIVQRTGIHERRRTPQHLASSDLAYHAVRHCLETADVTATELDLILLATCTPDTFMPSAACHLQKRLGTSAAAMDLNAACAGFIYALITGAQFIKTGCSRRVLVVGADTMMRTVDPEDRKTFPLFGDGAGAVLLGPGSHEQGLVSYTLGADGRGADLLCIPGGAYREPTTIESLPAKRQFIQMQGRHIFKWAVRMVADAIRGVLQDAQIATEEVAAVVMHQANARIIDAVATELDLPPETMIANLDRYGNTSAGSIPLVLDEACSQGRIGPGDFVVFCGFGAGLTWGAALMRW